MIKVNDIVELKIEKLTYGTSLISRLEDGFVVFVDNVCPYDVIKAKITNINKSFARAQVVEIIEPSPYRTKPVCPLFNACGSCNFQNWDYEFLLEQKNIVLKDIFSSLIDEKNIYPIIKSPKILHYRHKIQYPSRETKNSKRVLLGYYKNNSHDLTNIKFCPMQPEIINKIAQFIRDNYTLGCYNEKKHKGLLKNVLFRISTEEEILLTLVLNTSENTFNKHIKNDIESFFNKICAEFSSIKGCFVNLNPEKSNKILSDLTIKIKGEDFLYEKLSNRTYKIGSDSFFQVNPKGAVELFNIVKDCIKPDSIILDAYCGVGAIGIYVSEKASRITFVEENKNAIIMAKENLKINNISNYELFEGDVSKYLLRFYNESKLFDYVIADPPRAGIEKEGLEKLSKIAKNIIYVSCNPQTLRRDMIYLSKEGFKPKFIKSVDMFPYTYHIECVVLFEKG